MKLWFERIVLGVLFPLLLLGGGVATYIALGKAEPKQTVSTASDAASRMLTFPIVQIASSLPFDQQRSLDLDLNGLVVPFRQITVAAEVAGRIANKAENCRAGRYVEQGELLYQLDSRDFQLDLERLTKLRDQEYATLREWEQEKANVQKSQQLAMEELAIQEREIARLEKLPAGFASETELDQARRVRIASANQVQSFTNQLALLDSRRQRLELAQQLVATQLEQAQLNLERTEIRAPVAGLIVREMAENDSYIQKGATLCEIEDTSKAEVKCNMRMDQLMLVLDQKSEKEQADKDPNERYLLPPTPVSIIYRVAGRENDTFQWQGRLSRYEGVGIDPQTRTVPVRITVDRPGDFRRGEAEPTESTATPPALVRGMFVDVILHLVPQRNFVLIPKLGLRPGNQLWKAQRSDGWKALVDPSASPAELPPSAETRDPMDRWEVGNLASVEHIEAVRTIQIPNPSGIGHSDFWIVESQEGLRGGELIVTSPLATVRGDGTDWVRWQKDPASSAGESNGREGSEVPGNPQASRTTQGDQ